MKKDDKNTMLLKITFDSLSKSFEEFWTEANHIGIFLVLVRISCSKENIESLLNSTHKRKRSKPLNFLHVLTLS